VVGAHYDVVRLQDGSAVGGAVDNGAASVVLTRVAGALRRHELNHRVRVVLFDLEEIGLRGSAAYIASQQADRIAAMVNVDVIAGDGTLMYGPTSHEGNDTVYRSLRVVCAATGVSCMGFPRYPPSDDRSFQAAGIPNVSIGMNGTVAAHQMWLILNGGAESGLESGFVPAVFRVIHTPEDTMQHANESAMKQLHDLVVALVLELDKALE
jgi:Zn-dependent M28 family amino/carboxypeptidase